MDKKQKQQKQEATAAAHCGAENCKKTAAKHSFCNEHFLWFKAGLIKKDGTYPKDFDKKYNLYIRKSA